MTLKSDQLKSIVSKIFVSGKGILAADESLTTIKKRFQSIKLNSTFKSRSLYRKMLFSAPGINQFISGVILFEETLYSQELINILKKQDILIGIKVDQGLIEMPKSKEEKITQGLKDLEKRLKEYASLGACFAKWRAVIKIGKDLPSEKCLKRNAQEMAKYAYLCQKKGLVPIVEPEVLMEGDHSIKDCALVSEKALKIFFTELKKKKILMEGIILKPNMIIEGSNSKIKNSSQVIARETLKVFQKVLPKKLGGIAFLSGGQSESEATKNLGEFCRQKNLPWKITFSFGRALQNNALKTWNGKTENFNKAQKVFLKRARSNSLAVKPQLFD